MLTHFNNATWRNNMKKTCNVRGAITPGAMCGDIIVGGELCGSEYNTCVHQQLVSDTLEKLTPMIREAENTNPVIPITPERSLDSFGFDDLDLIELIMGVEDELNVELDDTDLEKCKTVGDLVALVEKELAKCA